MDHVNCTKRTCTPKRITVLHSVVELIKYINEVIAFRRVPWRFADSELREIMLVSRVVQKLKIDKSSKCNLYPQIKYKLARIV